MAKNWRKNLGSTAGTIGGGILGGLAGIPGGPAGIATGAGIGAGLGGAAGSYLQGVANSNKPLPQNKGIFSNVPTTFPGSPTSPTVTAQNLGQEGSALFFSPYNQQQQALMDILGQLGLQGLQNIPIGQDFTFAPIAQQARTQFAQQTIPSIAERFTGLGAQRSSAFGQQLGAAGAGLEEALASLGQEYNLKQQGLNLDRVNAYGNLAKLGLVPRFESTFSPKGPSFGQSLATETIPPALQALTLLGGQYLMNKYGR